MESRGNDLIDPEVALAHVFPEVKSRYDARDLCLYALGIGGGTPLDDLRFVFEGHASFAPFPTFAVVPALNAVMELEITGHNNPGLRFGLDRVLHSHQSTEVLNPWPTSGELRHRLSVKDIYDRGRFATVVSEVRTFDAGGVELARNEFSMTIRGGGGWGGTPGPTTEVNLSPDRPPDAVVEQRLREDQALLYRLCGDLNPLHVDPCFAEAFGLPRPILHGLCTYGFAARHVLRSFADNDPTAFRSVRVKFASPVFPGETLVTEMWRETEGRVVFRCKVKERDKVVLSNAKIVLRY
jgi:(3R)-3-hydroxyacyl-CoA dehydrogenase / 3a,7a,12a-trihydroxy-5b-cholest-24-enoyl-CoA hydratase / enoyl-CoA hydratase 2